MQDYGGDKIFRNFIDETCRTLSQAQRNYSVTKRELLAVVTFCNLFRHYLLGAEFDLWTDYLALTWLHSFDDPTGLFARWIEQLSAFQYVIKHRSGKSHANADGLPRLPERAVQDTVDVNAVGCSAPDPPEDSNWAPVWTIEQLRAAQQTDNDLDTMLGWQEALLDRPKRGDPRMVGASRKLLRLWGQWVRLKVVHGVLYRQFHCDNGPSVILQLVVPDCWHQDILAAAHNDVSGGHLGVQRTLAEVRQRFYWPFMSTDVELHCANCPDCCARKSPIPNPRAPMSVDRPSYPLQRVAIDLLGPLPPTKAGNRYLAVICDYFTKWPEAFPISDIKASTVASAFVDGFVCRYGAPVTLHSDQGGQFTSQLFITICQLLDINKTRTTPYHPQSDGLVERMNRTLIQMLSAHVNEHHNDWDIHLQQCLLAYRSSVHSSTLQTPAKLMFGREMRLPIDLMFNTAQGSCTTPSDYLSSLRGTIQRAYDHARSAGANAQRRQKTEYDVRARQYKFQEGEFVYLHNPVLKAGECSKFHRPWKGPYKVVTVIDDVVVRITEADHPQKTQVVHIDRLKPFPSTAQRPVPNVPVQAPIPPTTQQKSLPVPQVSLPQSSIQYFEGDLQPLQPMSSG